MQALVSPLSFFNSVSLSVASVTRMEGEEYGHRSQVWFLEVPIFSGHGAL
jgi:hypothetical protein